MGAADDGGRTAGAGAGGPLRGVKVLEFSGIGPAPYACMLLADMGADVVTVVRPGAWKADARQFLDRGRTAVELDLKDAEGAAAALDLAARADVLVEGFRPGVMERLGLGPEAALARSARLVYGRVTGWGQDGPLAETAGHDIGFIAVAGALDAFRSPEGRPVAPLNLVGDYGGGAMFLLVGVLAALVEARASGRGQVVDAAMCDGVASMLTAFHQLKATGGWSGPPGTNMLDGGAPFYGPYRCRDGGFFAVGALEPRFFAELCARVGLPEAAGAQSDIAAWPLLRARLEAAFLTKTRDEWAELLEGTDACAAPVLSLSEAPSHRHLAARNSFVAHGGHLQPAPAPRFSRTASAIRRSVAAPAAEALARWADAGAIRPRAAVGVGEAGRTTAPGEDARS